MNNASSVFFFQICVWTVSVNMFSLSLVVLFCLVFFLMQTLQKKNESLKIPEYFFPFTVFLSLVCTVVSTLMCPQSELPTNWIPLCAWVLCLWKMQWIHGKTAGKQLLKPTCVHQTQQCDLGGARAMVTRVFQKVPTTSLFYSCELPIFFVFQKKKTDNKKDKKKKKP